MKRLINKIKFTYNLKSRVLFNPTWKSTKKGRTYITGLLKEKTKSGYNWVFKSFSLNKITNLSHL